MKKKTIITTVLTAGALAASVSLVSCSSYGIYSQYVSLGSDTSTWNWNSSSDKFRIMIPNPNWTEGSDQNKLIFDVNKYPIYSDGPSIPSNTENRIADQSWYAPNDNYVNNFKTSYALRFENNEYNSSTKTYTKSGTQGTGWILDYKTTDDGTYPTTWYIATNLHVAADLYNSKNLVSENGTSYDPGASSYESTNHTYTRQFSMTSWDLTYSLTEDYYKVEDIKEGDYSLATAYKTNVYDVDGNVESEAEGGNLLASMPRIVFTGIDFLSASPQDWNQNLSKTEAIDFAVIEVVFSSSEVAKVATNDYANNGVKQFSGLTSDYLTQQTVAVEGGETTTKTYEESITNAFYMSGFPSGVPRINQPKIGATGSILSAYSDTLTEEQIANYSLGDSFNESKNYSTFELDSQQGIGDSLLFLPYFQVSYHDVDYNIWALTYSFSNSGLEGGSSGSKITNKEGDVVSIHAIGSASVESDISMALYSDGHTRADYNGYSTPAYDIIYGGKEGQQNSYQEMMKKLYDKSGITTNLIKSES